MKSRYRILGLCLVAVFMACAVASATASAAAPEFFHCAKLASKGGEYTSSTCAIKSETKTGEFEKKAVRGGSAIKFTDALGPTHFYFNWAGSYRWNCGRGTATGEVSGPKEMTAVRVALQECKAKPSNGGEECKLKSVGAAGAEEVVLEELSGKLGLVAAAEAPDSEVGLALKPAAGAGKPFVKLIGNPTTCVPETALVGSVIGEVELVEIMDTAEAVRFGVKGAKKESQTIKRFVGEETEDIITGNYGLPVGLESRDSFTFEEPIEVTRVVF